MTRVEHALATPAVPSMAAVTAASGERLRSVVEDHYDFVWRSLRRLGVPQADVDDAAQRVLLVASARLADIVVGKERAFLFATATHEAAHARRTHARRREDGDDALAALEADGPDGASTDEAIDQLRARAMLDRLLDEMPMELRAPFVLFEIEELSTPEIAELLDLPLGTAASRLRRAREDFEGRIVRWKAQHRGGQSS